MLTLKHLSIPELIAAAGGDPWKLNDTIQSGSPGEISELATSFRSAGLCITETDEEFNQAKKRFDAAWDRDDPAHPINDAEEVRRATKWLPLGKEQMAKVAADLQNIAATLAEGQRSGHVSIGLLEGTLQRIDNLIEAELQAAIAAGEQLDWSELKRAAVDATKQSLKEMTALRDAYGAKLDEVQLEMAAAARLRDFATVNDPNANPYAVQYAGERLDDYNMSKFVGSLPVDPVLGTDARQQARTRLEYQQKLGRQHRAAGDRRERLVGRRGHPQPGTRRGSRRCWRRQRKHFRPEAAGWVRQRRRDLVGPVEMSGVAKALFYAGLTAIVLGSLAGMFPLWKSRRLSPASIRRRLFWTGSFGGALLLFVAVLPNWRSGLFVSLCALFVLVLTAFRFSTHIKIGDKIYA